MPSTEILADVKEVCCVFGGGKQFVGGGKRNCRASGFHLEGEIGGNGKNKCTLYLKTNGGME